MIYQYIPIIQAVFYFCVKRAKRVNHLLLETSPLAKT
uniref:Uncharacterized protein MANES_09G005600 n=1 Tax=Rhizophora mucronata TaxID=61149 RepID=A0A2P2LRT5_RHIMU